MTKEKEEEIILTPAEESPWYKFFLETKELDARSAKPYGWHWFWSFYGLSDKIANLHLHYDAMQDVLPDGHLLKPKSRNTYPATGKEFQLLLDNLKSDLGNPEEIKKVDFSRLEFTTYIDFSNIVFPIDVSFEHTKFSEHAKFTNTVFYHYIHGSGTAFSDTTFANAIFSNDVDFSKANFAVPVSFSKATFSHHANFHNTLFSKIVMFTEVTFSSKIDFIEAKFSSSACFDNTNFLSKPSFKNATFCDLTTFCRTRFPCGANFDQTKFTGTINFSFVEFKNYVPTFHKASLYPNILWHNSIWPDKQKKELRFGGPIKNKPALLKIKKRVYEWLDIDIGNITDRNTIRIDQNAYETLAYHMESLDKYHDQHFFFRKETRCRRSLERNHFMHFSYWIYEKLADYGYGTEPAFKALRWHIYSGAGILAIMAFVNAWIAGWKCGAWEITKNVLCSIPVSFANAHSFLSLNKGPFKGCYEYFEGNFFFNTIWAMQTLFGIFFLFLFLLTLRIRFKLK